MQNKRLHLDTAFIQNCLGIPSQSVSVADDGTALLLLPKRWLSLFMSNIVLAEDLARDVPNLLHAQLLERMCKSRNVTADSITHLLRHTPADIADRGSDFDSVVWHAQAFSWGRSLLDPCLRGFEHDAEIFPSGSAVAGACCTASLDQRLLQREVYRQWQQLAQRLSLPFYAARAPSMPLISLNQFLQRLCALVLHCPFISLDTRQCFVPHVDAGNSGAGSSSARRNNNVLCPEAVITCRNNIVIFLYPFRPYTLYHALTYSSGATLKLMLDHSSNGQKHMFLLYQLLNAQSAFHKFCLPFGNIYLSDVYIDEALWIQVKPCFHRVIRKFICDDDRNDAVFMPVSPQKQTMSELVTAWCSGALSNYDYLMEINRAAGRELNDPENHYILPWVVDFSQPHGGFRDLYKSKYRLTKGDGQLDLTWNSGFTGDTDMPAHHIPETFSSLTYYIYKARQTPKSVLCKNVRRRFVPEEYPSTMRRLYEWTPDECVPEFYSDEAIFTSIHDDLPDLHVPEFCSSAAEFLQWHRKMLESDYVSARLHVWIDLYFGYLLTGEDAVRHKNVYLSMVQQQQTHQSHHQPFTHYGLNKIFERPHPRRMCCTASASNYTLHYRPWAVAAWANTQSNSSTGSTAIAEVVPPKKQRASKSTNAREKSFDAEFNSIGQQFQARYYQHQRSSSSRRADAEKKLPNDSSALHSPSIDDGPGNSAIEPVNFSLRESRSVGDVRVAVDGGSGQQLDPISELSSGMDALASADAVYADSSSADADCTSLRSTESGSTLSGQPPVAQPASPRHNRAATSRIAAARHSVVSQTSSVYSASSQPQQRNKPSIADCLDYIRHLERFLKFCHQMEGRDPVSLNTIAARNKHDNVLYHALFADMRQLMVLMLQIVLHKRALANAARVDGLCDNNDDNNARHLQRLFLSIGPQQQLPNIVRSTVRMLIKMFGDEADEIATTTDDRVNMPPPSDTLQLLILSTEFVSPLAAPSLIAFPFGLAELHGLISDYKLATAASIDEYWNGPVVSGAARPYIAMKNLSLRLPDALSRMCSYDAGSGLRLGSLFFAQLFRWPGSAGSNWNQFAFMCLCLTNVLTKYYGVERSARLFAIAIESVYQEELLLFAVVGPNDDVHGNKSAANEEDEAQSRRKLTTLKESERQIDLLTKLHGIDFVSMLLVRFGLHVFLKRLLPAIINQIIMVNYSSPPTAGGDADVSANEIDADASKTEDLFRKTDSENEVFSFDASIDAGEQQEGSDKVAAASQLSSVKVPSFDLHEWIQTRRARAEQFTATSCSTLIELASRLGPLITANYITSSLLKTLSLCYAQSDSLLSAELTEEPQSFSQDNNNVPMSKKRDNRLLRNQQFVMLLMDEWASADLTTHRDRKRRLVLVGDEKCRPIVEALRQCAEMYGEHFIISNYLQYAAELSKVALKQSSSLSAMTEAGMLGVMSLMTSMLPALVNIAASTTSSSSVVVGAGGNREKLVDCIDLIVSDTLYNTIELVTSSSHLFASSKLRHVLLYKWLDAVVVLCQLLGKRFSREYVTVPLLVRYFNAFSVFCCQPPSSNSKNADETDAETVSKGNLLHRKLSNRPLSTVSSALMHNLIEDLITSGNSNNSVNKKTVSDNEDSSAHNSSIDDSNNVDIAQPASPNFTDLSNKINNTSPTTAKSNAVIGQQCGQIFTRKLAHDSYVMFTHYLGGYHLQRHLINDSYLHELTIAHADEEAKQQLKSSAAIQRPPSRLLRTTSQQSSLLITSDAVLKQIDDDDDDDVELHEHFARPSASDADPDYLPSSVKSNRLGAATRFGDAAEPIRSASFSRRSALSPSLTQAGNTDSRPPTSTRPLPAGSNRLSSNSVSRWSGEEEASKNRHYPRVSTLTDFSHDDDNEYGENAPRVPDDADSNNDPGANLVSDDDSSVVIIDAAAVADELTASANSARHLQGNWLAYWLHESGRAEPRQQRPSHLRGTMHANAATSASFMPVWSIKQIPLQRYSTGQKASVRALLPLDAENSFICGSRDCTMFVYNISNGTNSAAAESTTTIGSNQYEIEPAARFQGAHRKSVFSMRFMERERLVCAAAYDGLVVWDPWTLRAVQSVPMPSVSSIDTTRAPSSTVCMAHLKGDLCWISCIDIRMRAPRGVGDASNDDTSPFLNIPISTFRPTVASLGLVRCLTCLPDNVRIAVGFSTGIISLIDIRFGFLLASVKAHDCEVLSLDIISRSAANSFVACSGSSSRSSYHANGDDQLPSSDFMLSVGIDGSLAVWCLNLLTNNNSSVVGPSSTANVAASPYVVYRSRLPPQLSDIVACHYDASCNELLCVAAQNRVGVMHNFETVLMQQCEKQQIRSNRAASHSSSTVLNLSSVTTPSFSGDNFMPFSPVSLATIDSSRYSSPRTGSGINSTQNFGFPSANYSSSSVSASSSNTMLSSLGSSSSFIGGGGIMTAAGGGPNVLGAAGLFDGAAVLGQNTHSNTSAVGSVGLDFDVQRLHSELFRESIVSLAPLPINKQLLLGSENGSVYLIC